MGEVVVFDQASVSSICGNHKYKDRRPELLEKTARTLKEEEPRILALMQATGLSTKNISSMLMDVGEKLPAGIDALHRYKDKLADIIRTGPFDANSIAGMLSGSGKHISTALQSLADKPAEGGLSGIEKLRNVAALRRTDTDGQSVPVLSAKNISSMLNGSGRQIGEGIDALAHSADTLTMLITQGPFDANSVASMLNGAGEHVATGIQALAKNRGRLSAVMDEGVFSDKNISSMLGGSGKNLASAIDGLLAHKERLYTLVKEGPFDAKSVAGMLNGAGKDIAVGVEALETRMPKLQALCAVFDPTEISTQLNRKSARQLGVAIDTMYEAHAAELSGNTAIPEGAEITVAASSPATARAMAKRR